MTFPVSVRFSNYQFIYDILICYHYGIISKYFLTIFCEGVEVLNTCEYMRYHIKEKKKELIYKYHIYVLLTFLYNKHKHKHIFFRLNLHHIIFLSFIMTTTVLLHLIIATSQAIWVDTYNTYWDSPGVGQWQSLPIGNGDFTANVWLEEANTDKPTLSAPYSLLVSPCSSSNPANQTWKYDTTTKLLSNNGQCVIATGNSNPVETTTKCDASNADLQWTYNAQKEFVSVSKGTCLDIFGGSGPSIDEYKCVGSTNQQWTISASNGHIESVRYPSECLTAESTASPNSSYNLWFVFGKSDTYDLTGERLKLSQLKVSLNPPMNNYNTFMESLYLSNATVTINTDQYNLTIFIDKNSDTLNIETVSIKDTSFDINASIISWRTSPNFNPGGETGQAFCSSRNKTDVPIPADVIMNNGCSGSKTEASEIIFYHRNNYQNKGVSEWEFNMKLQKLQGVQNQFKDPYYNVTWGGVLYLTDSKRTGASNGTSTLSSTGVKTSLLTFNVLTEQVDDVNTWISDVCKNNEDYQANRELHNADWASFWNRSWIEIGLNQNNDTLYLVSELYTAQRYLDALDGYSENYAIKFNGQSFTIDAGKGPDYKQWASGYWYVKLHKFPF